MLSFRLREISGGQPVTSGAGPALEHSDDATIWHRVVAESFVLISKDEDFLHMANRPNAGAQFIWVRLGNCRKQDLLSAFDTLLPQLVAALQTGTRVVEVR